MTRLDRELLADLDAGLLDPIEAARMGLAAEADPAAAATTAALAAVRADLRTLRVEPPVPPEFTTRWDAAPSQSARQSCSQSLVRPYVRI
jgi:hypothetical protein